MTSRQNIWVPDEIMARVRQQAELERRSLTGQLLWLIERGLETVNSTQRRTEVADRATRLPDNFGVTRAMTEWARREAAHVSIGLQTAQFCDYWRAASGARARKRDWVAAWRTWMRKAEGDLGGRVPAAARARQDQDDLFDRAMTREQALALASHSDQLVFGELEAGESDES